MLHWYKSVCVGFLYTNVKRELSGCAKTIVSRNGGDPSGFASSDVNWMCGSKLLMCSRKFSFLVESMTIKVSSTNLFHTLGGCTAELMALISKYSMKRLPAMGLMGDPVAAPCSCSKILPWNWKYMVFKQNYSRLMMCSTFMGVLVWSSGSSSNFLLMMVMADSIGTDVKSAETTYEVTHSPGCNLIPLTCCTKSENLFCSLKKLTLCHIHIV